MWTAVADRAFLSAAGRNQSFAAPGHLVVVAVAVVGETLGLEHFVAVAVRAADNQSVDFSQLAQATLEKARGIERTARRKGGLDSPLGKLLQRAMFGEGATEGHCAGDDRRLRDPSPFRRILPEKTAAGGCAMSRTGDNGLVRKEIITLSC